MATSAKKKPIEQTPEFAQAVSAAVAAAIPTLRNQILGNLATARGVEPSAVPAGDAAFAEALAMAISSLSDQGTGRSKRVDPRVMKQRTEARELMIQLIVEARAQNHKPRYQLRNKVYLDEMLVEPIWIAPDHTQRATEIEWNSVPNEAMIPVNETAKAIFKAFIDSIGSVEKPVAERPLQGVTAGGLVVRSGSSAMRPVAVLDQGTPMAPTEGGLNIPHRSNRPGVHKETRVLGTVAEPARETV